MEEPITIEDEFYIFYKDGRIFSKGRKNIQHNTSQNELQRKSRHTGGKFMKYSFDKDGYYQVRLKCYEKKSYQKIHRVIYEKFNGTIPANKHIDHLNNIRTDNRLENLVLIDPIANQRKQKLSKRNTSGHKGLFRSKNNLKWVAVIGKKGTSHFQKVFDSLFSALIWRKYMEFKLDYGQIRGKGYKYIINAKTDETEQNKILIKKEINEYKEMNKVEITTKERNTEYYIKNKEAIKKQTKAYRERVQERVHCEICNKELWRNNLPKHNEIFHL